MMVGISTVVGLLLGLPLGILLFNSAPGGLAPCRWISYGASFLVNSARSIPYIILTVLLIPFTRLVTGSSIGTLSAVVPLGLSAALLTARVVEDALKNVSKGLIEAGVAMGATRNQIIRKILVPECLPGLVSGLTLVVVSITGFSAMAGAVGGGGLGDLAIRYGYQRFNWEVLVIVVVILVALIQLIQFGGDRLSAYFRK